MRDALRLIASGRWEHFLIRQFAQYDNTEPIFSTNLNVPRVFLGHVLDRFAGLCDFRAQKMSVFCFLLTWLYIKLEPRIWVNGRSLHAPHMLTSYQENVTVKYCRSFLTVTHNDPFDQKKKHPSDWTNSLFAGLISNSTKCSYRLLLHGQETRQLISRISGILINPIVFFFSYIAITKLNKTCLRRVPKGSTRSRLLSPNQLLCCWKYLIQKNIWLLLVNNFLDLLKVKQNLERK